MVLVHCLCTYTQKYIVYYINKKKIDFFFYTLFLHLCVPCKYTILYIINIF